MIASLTGVSHERLIVFHNWVGWAMFALALIHTFPFIIFHNWKGDMVTMWNTSVVYWTGVVALIAQTYLQFFSLRFIRDRYYEIFKATHYLAALVFMIFFFFHCDFRLSSWDYFIATGVLYTLSFLYSQIRTYFEFGLSHRATFTRVSNLALKVTIPIDTTWHPSQHVFLRFIHLGLHALTAHPFTIASVPIAINGSGKSKLVFYVQPRGGLTGRLAAAALQQPGLTTTQVIIATRDGELVRWYGEALLEYMDENGVERIPDNITIAIYETGNGQSLSGSSSKDLEQSNEKLDKINPEEQSTASKERLAITATPGRPDITSTVKDVTLQSGKSVGIAVCGPRDVLKLVQDEAAAAQLRILGSQPSAREVYLHSEVFSW
ncbi:putative ferric reductase transmembrane protein [Eutypa lata UCREL1]|uniref:Putative ferric reductase transmembrane protein n=1 Tax=Eutypa lata (strain UCR-EL1) TaxID=1287681 RepID=M7T5J6_EUTLA|nr:putative ferric reductase transmembrane protein [Eutypa lata UCREL1]